MTISLRYYLVLERIGRSRYLGEASFGAHSLRSIFPDPKALSYIRNRLCEEGLIKGQVSYYYFNHIKNYVYSLIFNIPTYNFFIKAVAFSGRLTQVANRIVISSLVRFFVKRKSMIDEMVTRIVDYLKSQPNLLASYDQVKAECNISLAKTFKQPQLKKYCDTNLVS